MSSQLKAETARANGAKSRGPKTAEGRARSAQNSRRHGLMANSLVLGSESREHFNALLQDFIDRFQPADEVESVCVHHMVASEWQLQRCIVIRNAMLNLRLDEQIRKWKGNQNLPVDMLLGLAFIQEADKSTAFSLLTRYESSHRRAFNDALKNLRTLQAERPAAPPNDPDPIPQNEPNEPDPAPKPTAPETPQTPDNSNPNPTPAPLQNEPKVEATIACPCGRIIAEAQTRSGFRCRCGHFHKPFREDGPAK